MIRFIIFFCCLFISLNCESKNKKEIQIMDEDLINDLKLLANKKIFFGHQSVGNEIILGLQEILSKVDDVDLKIISLEEMKSNHSFNLVHSHIGKNYEPYTKCEDFEKIIDKYLNNKIDFALMKFCFVDIDKNTNVDELFNQYEQTINALQQKHPRITFIHVSEPLMSIPTGLRTKVKKTLGIEITRELDNIQRNRYNDLLIKTYANNLIFDLAKIESTGIDGGRYYFKKDGEIYYSLLDEFTYDGGHLNAIARGLAAKEFIRTLANLVRYPTK